MNCKSIILSFIYLYLCVFFTTPLISNLNATADFKIIVGTNSICNGGCITFEVDIDDGTAPYELSFNFRILFIDFPLNTITTSNPNQDIELCFDTGIIKVSVNDEPVEVETFGLINSGTVILDEVTNAGSCDVTILNDRFILDIATDVEVLHPGSIRPCVSEETCYDVTQENALVNPDPNVTVEWWIGNPVQAASTLIPDPTCVDLTSTNLWVRVLDSNSCSDAENITWDQPSVPDPNPAFTISDFCQNGLASQPIPDETGGMYSFASPLAPGDNAMINGVTGEIIDGAPNTMYDVMYTVSNGACDASTVETVTIFAPPSFVPGDKFCDPMTGNTFPFSTSGNVDVTVMPVEYNDVFGRTTSSFEIRNLDEGVPITIFITDNTTGCITQMPYTPTSCSCETIGLPNPDQTEYPYCDVVPTITAAPASGSLPSVMIYWYENAMGGNPLMINSISFTPSGAGTYYAEAIDINTNCTSNGRVPIVVRELDLPFFIQDPDTECAPDGLTYTATAYVDPTVVLMVDGDIYPVIDLGNGVFEIRDIPITSDVFPTLEYIDANCNESVDIIRRPANCMACTPPDAPTILDESGDPLTSGVINNCVEDELPTITAVDEGNVVAWFSEAMGGSPVLPDDLMFSFIGPSVIYAEAQSANGCVSSNRTRVEYIENEIPNIFVSTGQCDDATGTYEINFTLGPDLSFTNVSGVGNVMDDGNGSIVISGIPQGQIFELAITNDLTGCVNPMPVDPPMCSGCAGVQQNIDTTACAGVTSFTIFGQELTPINNDIVYDVCDTIYNIFVDFQGEIRTINDDVLCEGDEVVVGSSIYDIDNPMGMDILMSSKGCDSIVETDLTFMMVQMTEQDTTICNGDMFVVNGVEVTAPGDYTDTVPGNGMCDDEILYHVSFSTTLNDNVELRPCSGEGPVIDGVEVTADGSYTETILFANGCDSLVTTYDVQFTMCNQDIDITTTDTACANDSTGVLTVTVTNGLPPFTYTWEIMDGSLSGGSLVSALNTPVMTNNLPAGTYNVIVSDSDMMVVDEREVTINEPVGMMGEIITLQPITCGDTANGILRVEVSGGAGDYMYMWADDAMGQERMNLGVGMYDVTVTDANGCVLENLTTTLTGDISIDANVDFGNSDCEMGGEGFITISNPGGGSAPYEYSIDGGATFSNETQYMNLPAGDYSVLIRDANDCVQPLEDFTLVLAELADLEIILGSTVSIFAGQEIQLLPEVNFDAQTYSWTPAFGLSCTMCADPIASPSTTTTYTLTVEDISGCSISAETTIEVDEDGISYIPNVIQSVATAESPNTAMFYPMVPDEVNGTMDMMIFDRWGNKVHDVSNRDIRDVNSFWRADFSQENVRAGVFVYYIVLRLEGFDEEVKSGHVTVLN